MNLLILKFDKNYVKFCIVIYVFRNDRVILSHVIMPTGYIIYKKRPGLAHYNISWKNLMEIQARIVRVEDVHVDHWTVDASGTKNPYRISLNSINISRVWFACSKIDAFVKISSRFFNFSVIRWSWRKQTLPS